MSRINNLYKNYTTLYAGVNVGDEFKVYDLEFDQFYGQNAGEYRTLEAYSNTTKELSFRTQLFYELEKIIYYYTGEYAPLDNEEFEDVWPHFLKHWYYEQVWVTYSEEMLEVERKSWEDREDINYDKALGDCKFRLFRKVKKVDKNKSVYASLLTGIHYEVNEEKVPMVWASANDGFFYIWWREILKNWIGGLGYFFDSVHLMTKRLLRQKYDPERAHEEDRSLKCRGVIFDVDRLENKSGDYNSYDILDLVPSEVPKTILDTINAYFDTEASKLGYTLNMNDKRERLTTGENYKDLHGISNVQTLMLNGLNSFARKLKEKLGVELEFGLSNQSEAEGVPFMGDNDLIDGEEQPQENKEQKEQKDE